MAFHVTLRMDEYPPVGLQRLPQPMTNIFQ
jgi:hypothetical protein